MPCVFISIKQRVFFRFHSIQGHFSRWIKPLTTSLLLGTFADITRGKSELLAENALLRYQLVILRRQIKRPAYRKEIGFSWCFWPGWFEPGNRRSSLSSQRRFCAGIGSSSVCSGSANPEPARKSRDSHTRQLR